MGFYKRKAETVEARQWDGSVEQGEELTLWCDGVLLETAGYKFINLETALGPKQADPMDWILKTLKDEFYVVKADDFVQSFTPTPYKYSTLHPAR